MSNSNNIEEKPQEVDDFRFKEIELAIERYSTDIASLPKLSKISCPEYLSINIEDLRKKSIEELSEATFLISQYSLYIQRLINKSRSWQNWAKSKLDEVAAGYLDEINPNFNSYEKSSRSRNLPLPCKKLNQFIRRINMELETLNNVPNELKIMSDAIKDIKFSILRRENNAKS